MRNINLQLITLLLIVWKLKLINLQIKYGGVKVMMGVMIVGNCRLNGGLSENLC